MAEVRNGLSIATEGLQHVYPGGTRYSLGKKVEVIPLAHVI